MVYVWRMENGRDTQDLRPWNRIVAHNTYILKCLFSPDVRYVSDGPCCSMFVDRPVRVA